MHWNEVEDHTDFITLDQSRLRFIDLIIECKDGKGNEIRYGVERAVLTSSSRGFQRMFETCTEKKIMVLKIEKFNHDVILSFIKLNYGWIQGESWSLEKSSDLIDLAHDYGCDMAIDFGINKFCTIFAILIFDKKYYEVQGSRFGEGALMKPFSIWRRVKRKDLFCQQETAGRVDLFVRTLTSDWLKLCNLDINLVTYADITELDNLKLLTKRDYRNLYQHIQNIKKTNYHLKNKQRFPYLQEPPTWVE